MFGKGLGQACLIRLLKIDGLTNQILMRRVWSKTRIIQRFPSELGCSDMSDRCKEERERREKERQGKNCP
jgi:hypothetical protein